MNDTTRFVTFPLGEERYALNSSQVQELLMPSRVYSFPHTMPALEGVLVRRGGVIPVCDLGQAFRHGAEPCLYVVAQCNYAGRAETVAIPVNGGCELVQGERIEAPGQVPFGYWPIGYRRQDCAPIGFGPDCGTLHSTRYESAGEAKR